MTRVLAGCVLGAYILMFYTLSIKLASEDKTYRFFSSLVAHSESIDKDQALIVTLPEYKANDDAQVGTILSLLEHFKHHPPKSLHLLSPLVLAQKDKRLTQLEQALLDLPKKVVNEDDGLKNMYRSLVAKKVRIAQQQSLSALMNTMPLTIAIADHYPFRHPAHYFYDSRYTPNSLVLSDKGNIRLPISISNSAEQSPPKVDLQALRVISSRSKLSYASPSSFPEHIVFESEKGLLSHPGLSLFLAFTGQSTGPQLHAGSKNKYSSYQLNVSRNGELFPVIEHDFKPISAAYLLANLGHSTITEQHILIGHENDPALSNTVNTFYSLLHSPSIITPWWSTIAISGAFFLLAAITLFLLPLAGTKTAVLLIIAAFAVLLFAQIALLLLLAFWVPFHIVISLLIIISLTQALLVYERRGLQRQLTKHHHGWLTLAKNNIRANLPLAYEAARMCCGYKPAQATLVELGDKLHKHGSTQQAITLYEQIPHSPRSGTVIKKKIKQLKETMVSGQMEKTQVKQPAFQKPPFKTIGRYRIEKILGKGAMSTVYLGNDPKIRRRVAIKTFFLSRHMDPEERKEAKIRFHHEAETAGQLRHPHIVTIYDVDADKELLYIAMDYIPGVTLNKWLEESNATDIKTVYRITLQMALALQHAHSQGVIHRDIKPENVLYEPDRQHITVMDFGIAKVTDNSQTRTGTILGSPYYMSPEQIKGEKVDAQTDIFSLGVTFFQLLTHQMPFEGEAFASLSYNIVNTRHKNIKKLRKGLPRSAMTIVNKALTKDRTLRLSIDELIRLLEKEISH